MGEAYQISNQEATYYMTFQVVGWAVFFSRQVYRDVVIDSFKFCRLSKAMARDGF